MPRAKPIEKHEDDLPAFHPKMREHLVAHASVEKQLMALIGAGRLPHALLFTGPRGIGKATLAWRLARFMLAPQERAGGLFGDAVPPESLHLSPEHPTFRRAVLGSHPDLLVLEADDIKIEDTRKVAEFLSLTPAESRWRVVIIDSADAMNRNAANALLKTLEEPPAQALLILVSHNPGALLPTIRSRCRTLRLQPLCAHDFSHVLASLAPELTPREAETWSLLSDHSPGIAHQLMEYGADKLYAELIERLSSPDTLKLHAFAERFSRKDAEGEWQVIRRLLPWLITRLAAFDIAHEVFPGEKAALARLQAAKPLDSWIELWEKAGKLLTDADRLHLEKKQTILTLARAIAE